MKSSSGQVSQNKLLENMEADPEFKANVLNLRKARVLAAAAADPGGAGSGASGSGGPVPGTIAPIRYVKQKLDIDLVVSRRQESFAELFQDKTVFELHTFWRTNCSSLAQSDYSTPESKAVFVRQVPGPAWWTGTPDTQRASCVL